MIIEICLLECYGEIVYEFTLVTNTVIFVCYVSYYQSIFGGEFVRFVKKKHCLKIVAIRLFGIGWSSIVCPVFSLYVVTKM